MKPIQDENEARRRSIFSRSNIGPVGLYWIGYAPTDWIVTTLQRLFAVNSGDFLSPGDLQNDGFPVFGGNGFRGYFREKNCDSGTMLIGRYGALCGNVHIPTEPFWATEHAFRVRPLIEYHQPFVARYVEALELRYLATRAAQPGLNSRMVREQAIALPDIPTQKRIAAFLDRETARIDDLIAKKERLVAVLREGLLSELERLVTPDTPIHDQMIPFRWVCRITEGQVDPTAPEWADKPLIAPNHIESRTGRLIAIETAQDQGAISGKYAFPSGTVLYSKIRPNLAKACVSPVQGMCSADMYPVLPDRRLRPQFLLMQLLSEKFTAWATLESMRVAMPKINRETLGAYRLWVPSLDLQDAAAERFFAAQAKNEALSDKVIQSIDRLREYRAALITAAVTGQIDVDTYGKSGTTSGTLDRIEADASA